MTNKKTEPTEQKEVTIQEPVYTQADLDRAKMEIAKLTPEAYLELKDYIVATENQPMLPEAGGSVNTHVYGKHGGVIQLTARRADIIPALERLLAGVRWLREKQPDVDWTPHSPQSNLPVTYLPPKQLDAPVLDVSNPLPDETSQQSQQEPQYIPDQLAVSGQPSQASVAPGAMFVDVETVTVLPQPEERCNVDLFAAGHQYPDLMIRKWKNESIAKILDIGVQEADLIKPQTFKGKFRAEYEFSQKLSSSGKPYKNVTRVYKL